MRAVSVILAMVLCAGVQLILVAAGVELTWAVSLPVSILSAFVVVLIYIMIDKGRSER